METTTSTLVYGERATIYRLASQIERWPEVLPHYRWVRLLRDDGHVRVAAMAAWRGAIPVQWVAEQRLYPADFRVEFHHVGGVTCGMDVAWTLDQQDDGVLVSIWHRFTPRWPLPDALVHRVIGEYFVDAVAGKTLRQVKLLAEAEARGRLA